MYVPYVATTPRENSRVRIIRQYLKQRGAWVMKTDGQGNPDLICCYRGHFVAIEVKREEQGAYGVTSLQQYKLDKITKSGGWAVVTSELHVVMDILREIDTFCGEHAG